MLPVLALGALCFGPPDVVLSACAPLPPRLLGTFLSATTTHCGPARTTCGAALRGHWFTGPPCRCGPSHLGSICRPSLRLASHPHPAHPVHPKCLCSGCASGHPRHTRPHPNPALCSELMPVTLHAHSLPSSATSRGGGGAEADRGCHPHLPDGGPEASGPESAGPEEPGRGWHHHVLRGVRQGGCAPLGVCFWVRNGAQQPTSTLAAVSLFFLQSVLLHKDKGCGLLREFVEWLDVREEVAEAAAGEACSCSSHHFLCSLPLSFPPPSQPHRPRCVTLVHVHVPCPRDRTMLAWVCGAPLVPAFSSSLCLGFWVTAGRLSHMRAISWPNEELSVSS